MSTLSHPRSAVESALEGPHAGRNGSFSVVVACPDARPPAYEAAAGLAEAALLDRFATGFYYRGHGPAMELLRRYAPCRVRAVRRKLLRRNHRRIPSRLVVASPGYDLALAIENRLEAGTAAQRVVVRARTESFDRRVARLIARRRPDAALVFSDVGSRAALPACRALGVASVLSMVHGDVLEEAELLEVESAQSPDYFPLYLGDGRLDRQALDWLHARRLEDLRLADKILVPSEHIARTLAHHGTPRDSIEVIPYAADVRRFRPQAKAGDASACTFLFAGGVTQRKGVGYLLKAWAKVARPGWRLQLVGALPRRLGPLEANLKLAGVEPLGRVGPEEVAARMAAADVFVFPSLFEGSAVVTYEALASGLPCVATAESGTVARDGVEGFLVAARDVDALAERMIRLGGSPELRARMAAAARRRAEEYDWPRYHAAVNRAIEAAVVEKQGRATYREELTHG